MATVTTIGTSLENDSCVIVVKSFEAVETKDTEHVKVDEGEIGHEI